MKFNNLFILLFGMVVIYSSCSKEEEILIENNETELLTRASRTTDPSVVNETLKFTDFKHLDSYYREKERLLKEDSPAFLSAKPFEIQTISTKIVTDEFQNPTEQFNSKVNDPILASILNSNYEIQVGERIIKFLDDSEVVYINADDSRTRNAVNIITSSNDYSIDEVIENLPKNALIGSSQNISESLKPVCGCEINYESIDCTSFRLSGQCRNFIQQADEFILEVFFETSADDPSTPAEITVNGEGNFNFVFDVPQNQGDVFIHASINPQCWAGITRWYHADEPFGSDVCDGQDRFTNWIWVQEPGENVAISHKTSVYKNFWGSHEKAHLKSLEYNVRRRTWGPGRAALNVEVQAFRNDVDCEPINFTLISDPESCQNCSSLISYQNTIQDTRYCTQDVFGLYTRIDQGSQLQDFIEVEFVCCN